MVKRNPAGNEVMPSWTSKEWPLATYHTKHNQLHALLQFQLQVGDLEFAPEEHLVHLDV